MMSKEYVNYKKYSVNYDGETATFDVIHDDYGKIVDGGRVAAVLSDNPAAIDLSRYSGPYFHRVYDKTSSILYVLYSGAAIERLDLTLSFRLDETGVTVCSACEAGSEIRLEGHLRFGDHDQKETVACCIGRDSNAFRCGYGPATTAEDNALFDRDTDAALVLTTDQSKVRLSYDWKKDAYAFTYENGILYFGPEKHFLHLEVKKHIYEDMFNIQYRKLEKNNVFKRPPVGWMTWYAVQWKACEDMIVAHTEFQDKYLKDYGADTIWVDAEYRHRDGSGYGKEGHNNYELFYEFFPKGLKYLADMIREHGFIPALWICAEVDTQPNEYIEKNPEIVISRQHSWSGSYWMDPTHPIVLDEAMRKIIDWGVKEWGYDVLKWDALPEFLWIIDTYRDNLHCQDKSTREIAVEYFKKAREYAGENCHMLSCCGFGVRELDVFMQVFDSARIGGDIFFWSDMMNVLVHAIYRDYALHNIVLDNDPDSVVLRPKYNTHDQAVTRATMVSLLGMPYAFGDNLLELPEDRLEIIRRTIPVLPVHPMDINKKVCDKSHMQISVYVEKPDMQYTVASVLNLTPDAKTYTLDLKKDLCLDEGTYYVYDYWKQTYVGEFSDRLAFDLPAYGTTVYAIHKKTDVPQLISTSRHVTQGAEDVLGVSYAARSKTLKGKSHMIKNDPYHIVVAAPKTLKPKSDAVQAIAPGIWEMVITPTETGDYEWSIEFKNG